MNKHLICPLNFSLNPNRFLLSLSVFSSIFVLKIFPICVFGCVSEQKTHNCLESIPPPFIGYFIEEFSNEISFIDLYNRKGTRHVESINKTDVNEKNKKSEPQQEISAQTHSQTNWKKEEIKKIIRFTAGVCSFFIISAKLFDILLGWKVIVFMKRVK